MMKRIFRSTAHFFFEMAFARILMRPVPSRDVKNVLLSAYTGLGHFVLKSVLVKKIKEVFPDCTVTIIAGNSFGIEFVLEGYPTIILEQESSAFKKALFFLKLRATRFDVIFMPFDAAPKFLIRGSILAAIPIRAGHFFDHLPVPEYYYTHKVRVPLEDARSEIDLNLDLLQAVCQKDFQREYSPLISASGDEVILQLNGLEKDGYVCLQMGGANGRPTTKRWLENYFHELIQKLLASYGELKILALGDEGDSPIVDRICKGIESDRFRNICGQTSIQETKSLISFCKFLVCHDSGLLHMGNALRKNVIAIYGPSDPDFYALHLPSCHILQMTCDCKPKLGLFSTILQGPTEATAAQRCPVPKCMERLTVDQVFQKCAELIESP